jgi:hypothetical protein
MTIHPDYSEDTCSHDREHLRDRAPVVRTHSISPTDASS